MHAAVIRGVIYCQISPKTTSFQKQGTMISQFLHKGGRLKGIVERRERPETITTKRWMLRGTRIKKPCCGARLCQARRQCGKDRGARRSQTEVNKHKTRNAKTSRDNLGLQREFDKNSRFKYVVTFQHEIGDVQAGEISTREIDIKAKFKEGTIACISVFLATFNR